tara:strand:+ start:1347 stop:1592 length:246 start_codon:yes stop_codon:yes gene_type:complete
MKKNIYDTEIIKNQPFDNLRISWDYEDDPEDISQRTVSFLYTPDMDNTYEHFHIELNDAEGMALRNWLIEFYHKKYEGNNE